VQYFAVVYTKCRSASEVLGYFLKSIRNKVVVEDEKIYVLFDGMHHLKTEST
jgi:hypothetical protein